MSLEEQLQSDLKAALKAKDALRLSVLRMTKAGIQKTAIDKKKDSLDDAEVLQILSKQIKQARETIDSAKSSGRQDILDQTQQELDILTQYMPKPLSETEILALIDQAIAEHGNNRGQIMKFVLGKAAGSADGKQVNELLSKRLAA